MAVRAQPRAIETHLEPWRSRGVTLQPLRIILEKWRIPLEAKPLSFEGSIWDGVAHPGAHAMEAHPMSL